MKEALKTLEPPINVHVATDSEQASLFLRREGQFAGVPKPNLIFLDFNLPKSGSCDLLREIKETDGLICVPVAVLTTSDIDMDIRQAYQLHANCYIRKPADLDGFFSAIRETAHFWLDITLHLSETSVNSLK